MAKKIKIVCGPVDLDKKGKLNFPAKTAKSVHFGKETLNLPLLEAKGREDNR